MTGDDAKRIVVTARARKAKGNVMEFAGVVFGIFGLVAFVRVERLVKT
jgi:hypothetical protein